MPLTFSRNGAGSSFSKTSELDPVEPDLHLVGDAAVRQRLDQGFVGILHAGVFADDGDSDVAFRIADALIDQVPARKIKRRLRLEAEGFQHFAVETGGVIGFRHRVDIVHVARLDHRAFAHVAEQREFAPFTFGDRPVGAAEQNVGLDADGAQLLDRMLRRLGF